MKNNGKKNKTQPVYKVVHRIEHSGSNRTLVCTTEEPLKVREFIFPSRFYEDGETKKLNEVYDVRTCPDIHVSSSLGDAYAETGAMEFLKFSKFHGRFLGMERESLLNYLGEFHSAEEFEIVMGRGLVRILKMENFEIIFPTTELLDCQKVKKRT